MLASRLTVTAIFFAVGLSLAACKTTQEVATVTTAHYKSADLDGKWTGTYSVYGQTSYDSPSILDILINGKEVTGALFSGWHKKSFPVKGKFSGNKLELEANESPFTRQFFLTYNGEILQGEVSVQNTFGIASGVARFKRP